MATIGNVSVKIGVKVEPTEEFSRVAYALGFVRVVPCRKCAIHGTTNCPMKEHGNYMEFCSGGVMKNDD